MYNDFDLIKKHFKENNDIKIIPISDVHLGATEHMRGAWERFCKGLLDEPNTYITLGGDLINNATKSSVSNVYDEVMRPREQKRVMAKMLEPIKDRILCAVSGNHERRSSRDVDDDATYDIMCKLDLEDIYRENAAFIKIQIGNIKGAGKKNPTYTACITHGAGGGALTGSAVNRNERFGRIIDGADLLIVGHTHKPVITVPSKIVIDKHNNKVKTQPFYVITSTSWLSYGGYALQKMLLPSSHIPQTITLCGSRKNITVEM